jgi:predicted GIY-YIG superfamily endonuclease
MHKYYIYILKDPRDKSVRYVGCSVNPQQRYKQHLTPMYGPFSKEKMHWTMELRSLNLRPELEIIDEAENKKEGLQKENHLRSLLI